MHRRDFFGGGCAPRQVPLTLTLSFQTLNFGFIQQQSTNNSLWPALRRQVSGQRSGISISLSFIHVKHTLCHINQTKNHTDTRLSLKHNDTNTNTTHPPTQHTEQQKKGHFMLE